MFSPVGFCRSQRTSSCVDGSVNTAKHSFALYFPWRKWCRICISSINGCHRAKVRFPLNVYLLAFGGAFITTLCSVPLWRRWSYRTGLVDDPGHRKIHDRPIALAGGVAVLGGLLIPLLVGVVLLYGFPAAFRNLGQPTLDAETARLVSHGFERRAWQL